MGSPRTMASLVLYCIRLAIFYIVAIPEETRVKTLLTCSGYAKRKRVMDFVIIFSS